MAPCFYETCLQFIANKITIRDEDREVYLKDFDIIRDYILNGMCEVDNVFNTLYKGPSLFGSYSNNVRIKYPSEFDVIFKLSIPYSSYINVEEDEDRPGFVNLDFEELMDELYNCNGYNDVYNRMFDLVDRNNQYLNRSKLQTWLKGVMEDCLDENGYRVRGNWGDIYTLIYTKRGLAHTIYAKCARRTISIDFVPGICFGTADWIDVRYGQKFRYKCEQWYAVPKPTPGPHETRCYAFMICNPKVEHDLLLGNQNLKVVFRLLKSLRNAYGMRCLKSYFITTTFLWEIEIQSRNFWNNPLHIILEHMLETLASDFEDEWLPFFWNKELNLLDNLNQDDIENCAYKLRKAYNTLRQYKFEPNLTYKRCLTHFEVP
ncbi:cyclic GMP-AMP synthase-like receptor [Bactrocera neohumeralis]|uniref:cyclic GMP-AMP synthase-like receptor n=1 Tax=Bactrocera neohumeralis TaxID=98809 RepID=UPI002165E04F|nr:cyclic GMP-AMP synthase-like receptor [Bactrocera neohumeralis]XP_050327608.1 cyclic GMP-AMP synthase-like receptor [Bactrocera neohumeralis]